MTEDSERMMLLLKELALLKDAGEEEDAQPGSASTSKRKKEITREMKRLARARKRKASKE